MSNPNNRNSGGDCCNVGTGMGQVGATLLGGLLTRQRKYTLDPDEVARRVDIMSKRYARGLDLWQGTLLTDGESSIMVPPRFDRVAMSDSDDDGFDEFDEDFDDDELDPDDEFDEDDDYDDELDDEDDEDEEFEDDDVLDGDEPENEFDEMF